MIELMVKNIVENSLKIECIVNHINKSRKIYGFGLIVTGLTMYTMLKMISINEERINELKAEVEGIKSSLA